MILFEIADKKLAEIGFIKDEETSNMVMYKRVNKKCGYTQRLALIHGDGGQHIMMAYNREIRNRKYLGNNADGLTMYEARLCLRKMRELGWKLEKPKRRKKNA